MCGICGELIEERYAEEQMRLHISDMCSVISHRGPDEFGCIVRQSEGLAFGHQRLSIIDISSGQQPMVSHNGEVSLVFNGEIYNFVDLREELEAKGHVFQTHSDTETILIAYQEWGEACVNRLRGMFAFVIWDAQLKKLFCARDRLGIKPLYYFWDGKNFIFASELKAILTHPLLRRELDQDAVVDYFRLQYVPSPRTAIKNVSKLPAGRTLSVSNKRLEVNQYWQLSLSSETTESYETARQNLRQLLEEAIRIRLVSEVPVGAFLSGGTDSSIVVALMSQQSKDSIKTHCVGFEDKAFDERSHARYIAERFSTDHQESLAKLDMENDLRKIIWHMDEPFADASAIPTYYLCGEAKKRVTVCLSGDGGDEMFAGYNWYMEMARLQRLDKIVPSILGKAGSFLASSLLDRTYRGVTFARNIGADWPERHRNLRNCFTDSDLETIIRVSAPFDDHPIVALYESLGNTVDDPIKRAQLVDVQSYMNEDILMKVDKMSMAHSLEVRVPLIDHKVVEAAFQLQTSMKMDSAGGKRILKDCISDLVPRDFFSRKKQGFSVPLRQWLLGELRPLVQEHLLSSGEAGSGMLNKVAMRRLWQQFEKNRHRIGLEQHVWTALCFELWCNEFRVSA